MKNKSLHLVTLILQSTFYILHSTLTMSYFSADEQMERAERTIPAPWGLRGTARRAGSAVELELDWQRPQVPLDGFSVLLLTSETNRDMELASVAGGATHCRATLPLDAQATCLSVAVVARCGPQRSPPSLPLALHLSPLARPAMNAEPAQIIIAPTPPPLVETQATPQVEVVTDLEAIDAALSEAQAYLGKNGVFVRFKLAGRRVALAQP